MSRYLSEKKGNMGKVCVTLVCITVCKSTHHGKASSEKLNKEIIFLLIKAIFSCIRI